MRPVQNSGTYIVDLLFKTFNFFVNLFVFGVVCLSVILFLAQTSFAPLNLKLLVDYTFEQTVGAVQPYKSYFPAPVAVNTEEQNA